MAPLLVVVDPLLDGSVMVPRILLIECSFYVHVNGFAKSEADLNFE